MKKIISLLAYSIVLFCISLFFSSRTHADNQEPTLDYFRFQEGYLEWQVTNNAEDPITHQEVPTNCYGRTYFLNENGKGWIEDINGELSGRLQMTPKDDLGVSSGSKKLTIHKEHMRYTLKCMLFEKSIDVELRDWPSDQQISKFPSLNEGKKETKISDTKKEEKGSSKLSDSKEEKKTSTKKNASGKETSLDQTPLLVSFKSSGKGIGINPGTTNARIASFYFDLKEAIRIDTLTLSTPTWGTKKGLLLHVRLLLDGKEMNSWNATSNNNTVSFGGLTIGLFEADRLQKGKHRIDVTATVINPPSKKTLSEHVTLVSIQGIAGKGRKVRVKKSAPGELYSVQYDKNRDPKKDEQLKVSN